MQKTDGLRLFQFKICLWFLLVEVATAVELSVRRMPESGGGGKRKVEEVPCGRK